MRNIVHVALLSFGLACGAVMTPHATNAHDGVVVSHVTYPVACFEDEIAIWFETHHQCVALDDLPLDVQSQYLDVEQAIYRAVWDYNIHVRDPRFPVCDPSLSDNCD